MGKQSKNTSGNMLLLAGLGVGALMLFANKGNTQNKTAQTTADDSNDDADIPAAPKILAVNSNASESPLPTGIVSDEEGMEATASASLQTRQSNGTTTTTDEPEEQWNDTSSGIVPPLISTKLTPKEKAIIDKGVLSSDLALQRPDLYKAIYIKKHGGKGNGQKALQAADAIITRIQANGTTKATATQKKKRRVAIKLHPQAGSMVKAAQANTGIVRANTKTAHPVLKHPVTTRPSSKRTPTQHKATQHPATRKRTASPKRRPAHR